MSSSPNQLTNHNNILYFTANDGSHGIELWRSDGTESGTTILKDINSGSVDGAVGRLTSLEGILFFRADNGVNGVELWKTDGTESGTVIVKDIYTGSSSSPDHLAILNKTLFFQATDGTNGSELWKYSPDLPDTTPPTVTLDSPSN